MDSKDSMRCSEASNWNSGVVGALSATLSAQAGREATRRERGNSKESARGIWKTIDIYTLDKQKQTKNKKRTDKTIQWLQNGPGENSRNTIQRRPNI